MIPEAKLIKRDILIREMALPEEVLLTKSSTERWLCLALGLINPNETRTIALEIFSVLLGESRKGNWLEISEIYNRVKEKTECSEKTVYYHILKMKSKGLVTVRKKRCILGDGEKPLNEFLRKTYQSAMDGAFRNIERALERS